MKDKAISIEKNELIDFLQSVKIFTDTARDDLEYLSDFCEVVNFPAGHVIFSKGDYPDGIYFIFSGKVQIHDKDYVFATMEPPQFFGEYSVLDSDVRSATVTTLSPTCLIKLQHQDLHRFLYSNEKVARGLLLSLIKRLRENNKLEESLAKSNEKIKKQAEKLKRQSKKLKELNAMKDKFIAVMAHDLRNPLSTILGLVDILYENTTALPEKQLKNYLQQIKIYSSNTLSLLSDLLQWARSQSGLLKINKEPIDIETLFKETLELFDNEIKTHDLKVQFNFDSPLTVYASRNMIYTVVRNLLSNAVKFSPDHGIIDIYAAREKKSVLISIQNSGVSLTDSEKNKLFKMEEDVNSIGIKQDKGYIQKKGAGLGLILCQEFIQKHGGKIWVESSEEIGFKVSFCLPDEKK